MNNYGTKLTPSINRTSSHVYNLAYFGEKPLIPARMMMLIFKHVQFDVWAYAVCNLLQYV